MNSLKLIKLTAIFHLVIWIQAILRCVRIPWNPNSWGILNSKCKLARRATKQQCKELKDPTIPRSSRNSGKFFEPIRFRGHVSGFQYLLESRRPGAFMYRPIFSVTLPTRTCCWRLLYEWKADLDCDWLKKSTNTRRLTRAVQYYLCVQIWAVQCMCFVAVTCRDLYWYVPTFTEADGAKNIWVRVWVRVRVGE